MKTIRNPRLLAALCAILLCGGILTGCFVEEIEMTAERTEAAAGTEGYAEDSWAIYWYHCGSDLESRWGCASGDLQEMLDVSLTGNVNVVIQTGGADEWHNTQVDASKLQRYVYNSEGFFLVDEQPQANMGKADTLASFLKFCKEHYPAAHTMVLFWNHGGGSVGGAVYDENYDYDSLSLGEFYQAFDQVYDLSMDNPPFDIVGFDTCLMATVDTAYTFCDVAKYLVASEETEPGCGWYYTGWLEALSKNPGMDGAALGRILCDSFREGCEKDDVADEITLSVTDLSMITPLMNAYDALGQEALLNAVNNPGFFPAFGREATRSENYGGNTEDDGYTNLVDLGDLARHCRDLLPESSSAVQNALKNCVIYKVNGPYRTEATGLSCYYSYNGDKEDYSSYASITSSDAFKYLYGYELDGTLDADGMAYLNNISGTFYEVEDVPEVLTLEDVEADEAFPVYVDTDGNAVLEISPDVANLLKGVYFRLAYADEESDVAVLLGRDNDIFMDWENGVFRDNFRGVWGALDGHLAYMELIYEGDDYNTYSVPILLNGEEYNLRVVYDYNDDCYYIVGARKGLENHGMADKNLRQLLPDDEITMILYGASVTGDDEFSPFEGDTFTVTEHTAFGETDLGDGEFVMLFELVDARNDTAWSDIVTFTVEDGLIYTNTDE